MNSFAGYICLAALVAIASPVSASNVAKLHVTYQARAFDWCPKDTPVALLLTMDGPEVVLERSDALTVTVNRGVSSSDVQIRKKDAGQVEGPKGRFEATVELCGSFWSAYAARGSWIVHDETGAVLATRKIENDDGLSGVRGGKYGLPLFRSAPPILEFDEQILRVIEPFETVKTYSIGEDQ